MRKYGVLHGIPGQGRCKIVAHPDVDQFVYYWGTYYHKDGVWKLYSWPGTPAKYACRGMIVRASDVSYKPEEPKPAEKKPEEPERKRWRYPGDPDGQMGLLGEGVGK